MLTRVKPELLVIPEALHHSMMKTVECLVMVTILCMMLSRVKATMLRATSAKVSQPRLSVSEVARCDERCCI
jgi:hypothetical protein